jgi:membrane protein YqaA with SNARE-associated domain
MDKLLEILGLMLLSGTKFLLAPWTTMWTGYNFLETVLITSIGGIVGVLVFYHFGDWMNRKVQEWMNKRRKERKPKKTFSKRNKLIVKTKITYGLVGLAVITPTVLSIPVGSIIAARLFRQNKLVLPVLMASVVIWSLFISVIISYGFVKLG